MKECKKVVKKLRENKCGWEWGRLKEIRNDEFCLIFLIYKLRYSFV